MCCILLQMTLEYKDKDDQENVDDNKKGTRIAKQAFPKDTRFLLLHKLNLFEGEVVKIPSENDGIFKIHYKDGDEDEMELEEVGMGVEEYLKAQKESFPKSDCHSKGKRQYDKGTREQRWPNILE